jgi:hypothetical protein
LLDEAVGQEQEQEQATATAVASGKRWDRSAYASGSRMIREQRERSQRLRAGARPLLFLTPTVGGKALAARSDLSSAILSRVRRDLVAEGLLPALRRGAS